jgi:hypothetical protein
MNSLKKALIFFAPLILAVWTPTSGAVEPIPPTSVPEPSVLLLLAGGLGAGALARYLRKRK